MCVKKKENLNTVLTCAHEWIYNCVSWLDLGTVSHDEGELSIHWGAANVGSVLKGKSIDELPLAIHHPSSKKQL